jgi:hypothetical protein
VIAGLAVGIVTSLALTRVLVTFLYGTAATDPITFFAVSGVLIAVALLAGYCKTVVNLRVARYRSFSTSCRVHEGGMSTTFPLQLTAVEPEMVDEFMPLHDFGTPASKLCSGRVISGGTFERKRRTRLI